MRVVAQPSAERVVLGETIQVTVTVKADEAGVPEIAVPSSPDYEIERGRQSSQQLQIINGAVSASVQNVYTLRPKRAGAITVGSFVYRNPFGSPGRSAPFTLQVIEPPPAPKGTGELNPDESLAALLEVTPGRVYLGQQLQLTVTRFARENMDECRAPLLEVQQAWMDRLIDTPPRPDLVKIRGVPFERGLLARYALFPLASGWLQIPAVEVQCRTAGGGFFGGRARVLTRQTAAANVEVLPLPEVGRPAEFGGAVGSFQVSARLDRSATRLHEPVTLTVTVEGTGNLRGFKLSPPRLPAGLEAYAPTTEDRLAYDAQGLLAGQKRLEQILAPQQPGQHTLSPVRFAFFDPLAQEYRVVQSEPLSLTVEDSPVPARAGAAAGVGPQAGLEPISLPDLLPIRPGGQPLLPGAQQPAPLPERPLFWAAFALPPVLVLLLLLRDGLRRSRQRHERQLRVRGARRTAGQRLQQAARGPHGLFWGEVASLVHDYLQDRSGEPTRGLTREDLRELLTRVQGYPAATVARLIHLLEDADLARFGGGGLPTTIPEAEAEVAGLLDELEQHRPGPRDPAGDVR
ncbi:MAG: BatD family protein [Myxococcota bacterium]|nr:BatD family protein [Myxococcota bacterium]